MADRREAILARLLELAQSVQGLAEARRNALDVTGLKRPAMVILDGSEQVAVRPKGARVLSVQIMEAAPATRIYVGASNADQGSLCNLYRSRFLKLVSDDATLLDLIGGDNGELRYEGCSFEEPAEEGSREGRMEVNLVFQYPFRASDL